LRLFIWALLRKHHAAMSLVDAGALIDEAGGLVGMRKVIEAAVGAAVADPKDLQALNWGKPVRPRKARIGGAGANSSLPPAALA